MRILKAADTLRNRRPSLRCRKFPRQRLPILLQCGKACLHTPFSKCLCEALLLPASCCSRCFCSRECRGLCCGRRFQGMKGIFRRLLLRVKRGELLLYGGPGLSQCLRSLIFLRQ